MVVPFSGLVRYIRFACVAIFASLTVACASLPTLKGQLTDDSLGPEPSSGIEARPPSVEDLLQKLQCEVFFATHPLSSSARDDDAPTGQLRQALIAINGYKQLSKKQIDDYNERYALSEDKIASFKSSFYVLTGYLTADVQVNDGINPSLSFIDLRKTVNTNVTKALGFQWSGVQHKQYTQTIYLDLSTANYAGLDKVCGVPPQIGDTLSNDELKAANQKLRGNLGIKEIMDIGLKYATPSDALAYEMPKPTCSEINPSQGNQADEVVDPGNVSAANRPQFGSTIDFTIVFGLNGGPSWTLIHFKGPAGGGAGGGGSSSGGAGTGGGGGSGSGGSQGWINFTNAEKDTLQITFAPAIPGGEMSYAPQQDDPDPLVTFFTQCDLQDPKGQAAKVEEFREERDESAKELEEAQIAFDVAQRNVEQAKKLQGNLQAEFLNTQTRIGGVGEENKSAPSKTYSLLLGGLHDLLTRTTKKLDEAKNDLASKEAALKSAEDNLKSKKDAAGMYEYKMRKMKLDAAQAAQQNNTQMILQNLLNRVP